VLAWQRGDKFLTTGSDEARARAQASFKKEERAKEGTKAMMEYLQQPYGSRKDRAVKSAPIGQRGCRQESGQRLIIGGSQYPPKIKGA
jgi:hypothetical protein